MRLLAAMIAVVTTGGCASSIDLGLLQKAPADGTGGSMTGHMGIGAVEDKVVVVQADMRGDVAASGHRFALGGSVLGGLPIGRLKLLGRVGLWHAIASTADENTIVPTFEIAGYAPLNDHPRDAKQPQFGASSAGVMFGVREDLDDSAYTTVFIGLALFFVPGY